MSIREDRARELFLAGEGEAGRTWEELRPTERDVYRRRAESEGYGSDLERLADGEASPDEFSNDELLRLGIGYGVPGPLSDERVRREAGERLAELRRGEAGGPPVPSADELVESEQASEGWRCPDCERSNAGDAETCGFCGQTRDAASSPLHADAETAAELADAAGAEIIPPENVTDAGDGFELRIQLGNDAMQDNLDVARALRRTADALEAEGSESRQQRVRDDNGNTVGFFQFTTGGEPLGRWPGGGPVQLGDL
jgi:hypothetical protein